MKAIYLFLFLLVFVACQTPEKQKIENTRKPESEPIEHSTDFSGSEMKRTRLSLGQLIYVPLYSGIYDRSIKRLTLLTATVTIRNTDPEYSITIKRVSYYNSDGKMLQEYLKKPVVLGPLATANYVVEERDERGGSSAKFLIEWMAEKAVSAPIAEAVMISTQQSLGLSYEIEGEVIMELLK